MTAIDPDDYHDLPDVARAAAQADVEWLLAAGAPLNSPAVQASLAEMLPTTPCTEWTAARFTVRGPRQDRGHYGKLTVTLHGTRYAHRAAWIDQHGPIPPGMDVMHLCDNPPCVRIDHLRLGTRAQNLQMMRARGRGVLPPRNGYVPPVRFGEDVHTAKLTAAAVRDIRRLAATGLSYSELGRRYGVTHSTISNAVHRRTWRSVI